MDSMNWAKWIKEHKILLNIIIAGFFFLEIGMFAFAAMKSGRQSYMQVLDMTGDVIYEVKGATMTNFNKYYFENTFGPFENYQVRLDTRESPFPFRAWFSAAVGLPVGLVLLLAFVLKAAMVFIAGPSAPLAQEPEIADENSGKIEKILFRIGRFNIFIIGFIIFALVFLYWVVPNLLGFLAQTGMDTVLQFKWFFLGVVIALFVLFSWFLYMKYQLAKKSLEAQTEIRKYELQLEYVKTGGDLNQLIDPGMDTKKLPAPDCQQPLS